MTDLFTIDEPEPQADEEAPEPRKSRRGEVLGVIVLIIGAAVVFGVMIVLPKLSGKITDWTRLSATASPRRTRTRT